MERADPADWPRATRAATVLPRLHGVYALFLANKAALPEVNAGASGLLYIGRADNARGLEGRCHFNARTVNHSPRKSFSALLSSRLGLRPMLVPKPSGDTWGLEPDSDARLTAWMHKHLLIATELCDDALAREASLIREHAPPLNLNGCEPTAQHRQVAEARRSMLDESRRLQQAPTRARSSTECGSEKRQLGRLVLS